MPPWPARIVVWVIIVPSLVGMVEPAFRRAGLRWDPVGCLRRPGSKCGSSSPPPSAAAVRIDAAAFARADRGVGGHRGVLSAAVGIEAVAFACANQGVECHRVLLSAADGEELSRPPVRMVGGEGVSHGRSGRRWGRARPLRRRCSGWRSASDPPSPWWFAGAAARIERAYLARLYRSNAAMGRRVTHLGRRVTRRGGRCGSVTNRGADRPAAGIVRCAPAGPWRPQPLSSMRAPAAAGRWCGCACASPRRGISRRWGPRRGPCRPGRAWWCSWPRLSR